jgi:hypothetical protein
MTSDEYAQTLIEHFQSIGTAGPDLNLYQIFIGARKAVPTWLNPAEAALVNEAYQMAKKKLFPSK